MTTALRGLRVASVAAAALMTAAAVADKPFEAAGEPDPCAAYHVAGVRLGMASDVLRIRLGSLGTPTAAIAGEAAVPAALAFEVDGVLVEVELDRRPRRRRPAHVTGVRSAREESADALVLLEEFERRFGPADENPSAAVEESAGLTRRWTSASCGTSLELAIDEQIEWWQPRARSVVVRLRPFVDTGGSDAPTGAPAGVPR